MASLSQEFTWRLLDHLIQLLGLWMGLGPAIVNMPVPKSTALTA